MAIVVRAPAAPRIVDAAKAGSPLPAPCTIRSATMRCRSCCACSCHFICGTNRATAANATVRASGVAAAPSRRWPALRLVFTSRPSAGNRTWQRSPNTAPASLPTQGASSPTADISTRTMTPAVFAAWEISALLIDTSPQIPPVRTASPRKVRATPTRRRGAEASPSAWTARTREARRPLLHTEA